MSGISWRVAALLREYSRPESAVAVEQLVLWRHPSIAAIPEPAWRAQKKIELLSLDMAILLAANEFRLAEGKGRQLCSECGGMGCAACEESGWSDVTRALDLAASAGAAS